MLRTGDDQLRDLAKDAPLLVDAVSGSRTGIRLVRCVGAGGMSTVFAAELEPSQRSPDLSPLTPPRIAVKFLQLATHREFQRMNLDPSDLFVRETVALSRMMERRPPCEFVVGFYGCGQSDVETASEGRVIRVPWLVIDLVEGGAEGSSLTERAQRCIDASFDPIRALRLLRGITEGVRALHAEGILHRDLKPDNVLVAGPVDAETPKLVDCGIARVEGLAKTVAGMTPTYGGPEQTISTHGERNPLIGPWTDVHALAAVAWFAIAGEHWCLGAADTGWHNGVRRSLRTSSRIHHGFLSDDFMNEIDVVLRRGASHRLPPSELGEPGAESYLRTARNLCPSMFEGPERHASVDAFASDLFPVLERCAEAWSSRAARENRAITAFRPTQLVRVDTGERDVTSLREVAFSSSDEAPVPSTPGSAVFQPDGRVLARFGDKLFYFVGDRAHRVAVPEADRPTVEASRWLVRGPSGGYAIIGPSSVLLIRSSTFTPMPLPSHADGSVCGEIQAVVHDGRVFGIVTSEVDDCGGPELWTSSDGLRWSAPTVLPLGGDARSISSGPFGYLVVGAKRDVRGRALFLGFDGSSSVYMAGVNDRSPLQVALCGATREAWGAGDGYVLAFERGTALAERTEEMDGSPVAIALDPLGIPWLVCQGSVLRRHVESGRSSWRLYYERGDERPPLVGIGFSSSGARVLDAEGGTVLIEPFDAPKWTC